MKTLLFKHNKLQLLKLCGNVFQKFYSRFSSLVLSLSVLALTRLRILKLMDALRIYQDGQAVLTSLLANMWVSAKEAWTNKRFRVGVIVGMVAFPAWKSHLFFSIDTRIADFYYVNYAFYFNTIRGYLAFFFLLTGAFIALPQKWSFKWWAVPFAIFCATEIYAESFYTHWTDFYNPMPSWQVSLFMLFSMPAFYFSINYLVYRKYHLKDGTAARIIGISKTPGLSWERKGEIIEGLVHESENFNARV